MEPGPIPASLPAARAAVAEALHWPNNLGVELREIRLGNPREHQLLAVYIQGLADGELIRLRILEPLQRLPGRHSRTGRLTPAQLQAALPAPRVWLESDLAPAIAAVLAGATALFLEGEGQAVLVDTGVPANRPGADAVSEYVYKDLFGVDLVTNVALVRQRLRDPALVAAPHRLPGHRGRVAVIYLQGRADPAVVAGVRSWVQRRGGEEAMRRGLAPGRPSKFGLLPETLITRWPDRVAPLLDTGHVAVLMDRLHIAYVVPVTAGALLWGPFDDTLARPISHLLRFFRLLIAGVVLLASGSVVALMNYHQEMLPAPFLLSLASVRENAPLPVVVEVLVLEAMQELMREAGFHLPGRLGVGAALIAGKILVLILVQGGVVGALPGAVSVAVAFATLGLLNYELVYLLRVWRFAIIGSAGFFGFFGMATVLFLFTMYLAQSRSFGVPFFWEPGLRLTAPGRVAARQPGRQPHAP